MRIYVEGDIGHAKPYYLAKPGLTNISIFFLDMKSSERLLCPLICNSDGPRDFLDVCPMTEIDKYSSAAGIKKNNSSLFPMLWRYLPALDYQVETFLSRDIDSNLNVRERYQFQIVMIHLYI